MHNLRISLLFLLAMGLASTGFSQDQLLLTNGKTKHLNGQVVYYDYNDIFYQNEKQRANMERYLEKRSKKQEARTQSERWQRQQAKEAARLQKREEKLAAKLQKLRKEFEARVAFKLETLSPADFERWKTNELEAIKAAELKRELAEKLQANAAAIKQENEEARHRRKFTRTVSRSKVFSILKPDGTEEVVYNADTLGYFADGEAELEYGVAEMRMYIKGRQDGRKHSLHDLGIGAGVGLLSSVVFTWTLDAFYAPIPPAISLVVLSVLPRKVNPKLTLTQGELQSQAYIDGYERSATGRKAWAFAVGSIAGLGIGTTAALLTAPLMR